MLRRSLVFLILIVSLQLSFVLNARADLFKQGSSRLSLAIGSATGFNTNYSIIGAGYGHYVLDGLELGIDANSWIGDGPGIYEITPSVMYVAHDFRNYKPYLGLFYNRTFIEDTDDDTAYGYRAGVIMPAGAGIYVGVGVVESHYTDCTASAFYDCSDMYSEVRVMLRLN